MNAFAQWLVRRPLVVLALNVLVTLLLGFFALQIRIESSLSSVLPAGDPQIEYYETRPWQPWALGVVEDWVEARAAARKGSK